MHPTSYIKLGNIKFEEGGDNLKHALVVLCLSALLPAVATASTADTSDTSGLFDSADTDTDDTDVDTDTDTDTDLDTDTAVLQDTGSSDFIDGSTASELAGELGGAPRIFNCASSTSGVGIPLLGFVILIGLSRRR